MEQNGSLHRNSCTTCLLGSQPGFFQRRTILASNQSVDWRVLLVFRRCVLTTTPIVPPSYQQVQTWASAPSDCLPCSRSKERYKHSLEAEGVLFCHIVSEQVQLLPQKCMSHWNDHQMYSTQWFSGMFRPFSMNRNPSGTTFQNTYLATRACSFSYSGSLQSGLIMHFNQSHATSQVLTRMTTREPTRSHLIGNVSNVCGEFTLHHYSRIFSSSKILFTVTWSNQRLFSSTAHVYFEINRFTTISALPHSSSCFPRFPSTPRRENSLKWPQTISSPILNSHKSRLPKNWESVFPRSKEDSTS